MIKLRPYQDKAVSFAINQLFEEKNALIVAGTGAGKTIMLSEAIKRFAVAFKSQFDEFPHTLVLVHRNEIHNQNLTKFQMVAPSIPTSEITAERKSVHGIVHFGMVQTVTNIIDDLPAFDLIVIDEAHHSMASSYLEIIEKNNKKKKGKQYVLGVSATPNRGDKIPLIDLFNNFYQITTKFLIDSHYLVRPKFIDLTPSFNGELGHISKNVDWEKDGEKFIRKLIDLYLENKEEGKSIIFAPNHKICHLIEQELKSRSRKPAYLKNNISEDDRIYEIERFEKGDAEELINVDIATEGYDYPNLRNVVDFDTNGNETQWIQKVGRALRIAEGKNGCTIIDFGGNIKLYPDVEVQVNLEGEFKSKKGEKLNQQDFFMQKENAEPKEKQNAEYKEKEIFTPYSLPLGWESMNDEKLGIVYTFCGNKRDAIIIKNEKDYSLFVTNKIEIKKEMDGGFNECMTFGNNFVKETNKEIDFEKPISKMQIKKLSFNYPTMTLNHHSANCIICWECWKEDINEIQSK